MTSGVFSNSGTWRGGTIATAAALCALAPSLAPSPAHAATEAGTVITNTASMTFETDGAQRTEPSNTVTLTTAELLDVAVAAERASLAARPGQTLAIGFVVTNTGNGAEDYAIGTSSDVAAISTTRIVADSNGNGQYDADDDQPLTGPIVLAVGQQQRLFVLVDGGQVTAGARVTLSATAQTGSGSPGTVFAGAGARGSDAVIGQTGATASASTALTLAAPQPSLTKSQTVFAPDGSGRPVRGAIVTYRLVAAFPAATRGVAIDDPIPAGTAYVPGSLTLDDRTLTDARDADSGTSDATGIHVALGDVTGAATHTVQFSVKIQ